MISILLKIMEKIYIFSISHASALDKGLRYVDTKYCLIIDPDTYIFKSDWDTFCLSNLLEKNE